MADRVHPAYSEASMSPLSSSEHPLRLTHHSPGKPIPQPGTYVIQLPKDQIYRVPPPENAYHLKNYARRSSHRSSCHQCICFLLAFLAAVVILAGISTAVLYLVFRPESPRFSLDGLAIRGVNVSSASPDISPAIAVSVRAENPNGKLGFHYGRRGSVRVYYSDVQLCEGDTPSFYQGKKNVTVLQTALTGPKIELEAKWKKALRDGEKKGKVPLKVRMEIPVKVKVGAAKTWTLAVKLRCNVAVDKLTAQAKIVSQDCDRSWRLWW